MSLIQVCFFDSAIVVNMGLIIIISGMALSKSLTCWCRRYSHASPTSSFTEDMPRRISSAKPHSGSISSDKSSSSLKNQLKLSDAAYRPTPPTKYVSGTEISWTGKARSSKPMFSK